MTGEELAGVLIGAFLIALGSASVLVATLRSGRPMRILLSFGLSAGLYGLRRYWRPRMEGMTRWVSREHRQVEPLGMLVFILCLGHAVVRSVIRAEAELAGVQRDLETARRIQSSLLPRQIPSHAGLDVAVRFVPVTAVAGDIYDFVQLGPARLGILVADVSGHGIPAALVASMVKVAFSAQIHDAIRPGSSLR